jgi:hypothetical protein
MTMDVTKAPPLDPSATRAGAGPTSQRSAAAPSSGSIVALADRVDIQPLDVAAALQILIAEVRMAMEVPADSSTMQSPAQTSRVLIQMLLTDEPLSPMWLRPEWLGLAPGIARFWRRRHLTRRGLTDPDFRSFREADERDPDSVGDKPP